MSYDIQAAEADFAFLAGHDFTLVDRLEAGTGTSREGWRLTYDSPRLRVVVEYLDWQLNVIFRRESTSILYSTIDQQLYARRSGFHGDMFPPDKVAAAARIIATDIEKQYAKVLDADKQIWERLERLSNTPPKLGVP